MAADLSPTTVSPTGSLLLNTLTTKADWMDDDAALAHNETSLSILKQPLHMIVVYSTAYAAVFVLGVAGNSLVIWIVYSNPRMHDVTNYLIVNLAVADILVCLFCLPITLLSNLYSGWRFGAFMCKAAPFLQGVSVSASVNTLMAIALDRYIAICHVLKFRLTSRNARLMVAFIWIFAASLMSPWAVYYHQEPSTQYPDQLICEQSWPSPEGQRLYFLTAIFITCYTIPLTCITICYALIGYRVCNRHSFGKDSQSSSAVVNKSKVKVVKMLVVVVVMFAFSWLPLYAVHLRLYYGRPINASGFEFRLLVEVILPLIQWSGSANSCVNPIIYCFFSKKFRDGFRDMVIFCRRDAWHNKRDGMLSQRRSTIRNSFSCSEYDRHLRTRRICLSPQASVRDCRSSGNGSDTAAECIPI